MRVRVTFNAGMWGNSGYGFVGVGYVHLTEQALILEGDAPRFYLPGWSPQSIIKLYSDRTFRTIPYSRIEKYEDGKWGIHRLSVRLSDYKLLKLSFNVPDRLNERNAGKELADRVEEYRMVAQNLLGS